MADVPCSEAPTIFRCAMCGHTQGSPGVCASDERRLVPEKDWRDSDEDSRLGQTLAGRFTLLRRLGRGGMGNVYLAEQAPVGRMVALKLLRPDIAKDETLVRRFEREGKAASLLSHPNVVMLLDFGQAEDGNLFLVMEFVKGRSLRSLIRRYPEGLPVPLAVHLASQVIMGVGEAHRAGVFHRDLKPENVQLTEVAGEKHLVKVLDFGLALLCAGSDYTTPLTRTGTVLGTPQYMAPEQCAGTVVDGRADIYAIGAMLYELLSGKVPFDGPSMTVMFKQVQEQPQPILWQRPDLPPALATLVMRCLAKSPEDRPADMEALLAELQQAAGMSAPGSEEAVHLPRPLDESDAIGQLETAWAEDVVAAETAVAGPDGGPTVDRSYDGGERAATPRVVVHPVQPPVVEALLPADALSGGPPAAVRPAPPTVVVLQGAAAPAAPTVAVLPLSGGLPGSRRPMLVVAIAIAAAGLLGGGAWALWAMRDSRAPSGEEPAAKADTGRVVGSVASGDTVPAPPSQPPRPSTPNASAAVASTAPASVRPAARPTPPPPRASVQTVSPARRPAPAAVAGAPPVAAQPTPKYKDFHDDPAPAKKYEEFGR